MPTEKFKEIKPEAPKFASGPSINSPEYRKEYYRILAEPFQEGTE
jgi:hypothetical protein